MSDNGETAGRKIVFIDDHLQIVELLTIILERNGFRGFGALNGQTGLNLIASEKPDLVLLDLLMPEMDGWEVYQRMKNDEAMRGIPVIIVTAKAQPIDIILARNIAKVQDYIIKPFTPDKLIDSINQVLGISEAAAV